MKSPEAEDKLYQLKLLWRMVRVEEWKVHYGTELDEWTWRMTMKLRHCLLLLKVGSIWNILTVVPFGSFCSSASKWISWKLDDWNPTNWTFFWIAIPSCIVIIIAYKFWYFKQNSGARTQIKWLTFDPPLSAALKKFSTLMMIGWNFEGHIVLVLVSSLSEYMNFTYTFL